MTLLLLIAMVTMLLPQQATSRGTTVIANDTDQDLAFELTPERGGGYWPGEDPDEVAKRDPFFDGRGERSFLLPRRSSLSVECVKCEYFSYDKSFIPGPQTIEFHSSPKFFVGGTYVIRGGTPVFQLTGTGLPGPLQGLILKGVYWSRLWIFSTRGVKAHTTIGLNKSAGVWELDADDIAAPQRLHSVSEGSKEDNGSFDFEAYTEIVCSGCGNSISITSVDDKRLKKQLEFNKVYDLVQRGSMFALRDTHRPVPPIRVQAPPAAAGLTYIVNGQTVSLSFSLAIENGPKLTQITLLGRQGHLLQCRTCRVKITTAGQEIERTLEAGSSYIIVFDPARQVYDFRVYSR